MSRRVREAAPSKSRRYVYPRRSLLVDVGSFEKTFHPGSLQGSGTFGQVFRGFCSKTQARYAVKVFRVGLNDKFVVHKADQGMGEGRWSDRKLANGKQSSSVDSDSDLDEEDLEDARAEARRKERAARQRDIRAAFREAAIVRRLDHPNLLRFVGMYHLSNGWLSLVTEYAGSRSLRNADIRDGNVYWGVWLDMCSALSWLHDKGIVHRDIKPSNVVITRYNRAVLIDFGLAAVDSVSRFGASEVAPIEMLDLHHNHPLRRRTSKQLLDESGAAYRPLPLPHTVGLYPENKVCGSCSFLSPQALESAGPDEYDLLKNDVYGLGVTMYHILPPYGYPYIEDNTLMKQKVTPHLLQQYRAMLLQGEYKPIDILCSTGNRLLKRMLEKQEKSRTSADEIYQAVLAHVTEHHPRALAH